MYVVFPTGYSNDWYESYYNKYEDCKIGNYSSHNIKPISKEEVRKVLINEKLI